MSVSPLSPAPVQLSDPADFVAAVPHLLGFHPTDSLVAVALVAPRARIRFTMRLDLTDDPLTQRALVDQVEDRMRRAAATAVLVCVFRGRGRDSVLPHADLVDAIQRRLPVPVLDALLVDADRCWSYLCDDERCCPAQGRPVRADSKGATAMAAAAALVGDVVLPDRAALLATVRPVGGAEAASMRAALTRAGRRPVPAPLALRRIDRLCGRYDDPPVSLSHAEAAQTAVALHRIDVRDRLLQRLARGDTRLELLVREVARLAQPPDDAPIATLLAAVAYLRGDGVVVGAALDRALETDPHYSLADLLDQSLQLQVEPDVLRAAWAGADLA